VDRFIDFLEKITFSSRIGEKREEPASEERLECGAWPMGIFDGITGLKKRVLIYIKEYL